MSLNAAMDHGERLAPCRAVSEIVETQVAIRQFQLKSRLSLHAIGMVHPFADDVADSAFLQINDEGAATAEFGAAVGWKPALGDFNDKIGSLLPIRSNPAYRANGMDFEVPELARLAV